MSLSTSKKWDFFKEKNNQDIINYVNDFSVIMAISQDCLSDQWYCMQNHPALLASKNFY